MNTSLQLEIIINSFTFAQLNYNYTLQHVHKYLKKESWRIHVPAYKLMWGKLKSFLIIDKKYQIDRFEIILSFNIGIYINLIKFEF